MRDVPSYKTTFKFSAQTWFVRVHQGTASFQNYVNGKWVHLHHMANGAPYCDQLGGWRDRVALGSFRWVDLPFTHTHTSTTTYTQRHQAGLSGEEQRWSGRGRAAVGCWRWGSSACTVNMMKGMDPLHPFSSFCSSLHTRFFTCPSAARTSCNAGEHRAGRRKKRWCGTVRSCMGDKTKIRNIKCTNVTC